MQDESGAVVVNPETSEDAVASVDGVGYTTLQAAIDVAPENGTVTVLKDINLTSGITLTKPLKIVGTNNKPTITIDSDAKIRGFTLAAGSGGTEFTNLIFKLDMDASDSAAIYFNDQFDNNNDSTPVKITNVDFIGDDKNNLATSDQQAIGILSASPEGGYVEVTGCTFKDLKYAMYFNRINHLTVTGNTIDGTRYGAIIVAADNDNRKCEDIKISQNNLTNISVTPNYTVPQYSSGIALGANTGSTVVENNSIQMADSSKKPVYIAQSEGDTSRVIVTYVNNGAEMCQQILSDDSSITLPTLPDQGYNHFVGWRDQGGENYEGGAKVENISKDMTFTAQWAYIPPANPNYRITIGDTENGSVTANPTAAKAGTTVTLTATPDEGYAVGSITVTDRFGDAVKVTEQANGTYTFVMPDGQVTVNATFVASEEPTPAEPFTDVDENDWFYDEVVYVYENGLMNGVENNLFAPNTATNRAMLATILYRLAGQPDVSGEMPFTDVAAGQWYTDAVLWAAQNGIVNGLDEGTFAPMNTLTREQLVTMLYRYAEAEGYDVSAAADLSGYPDAGKVQTYAQEAMSWAVAEGIVEGMDGNLNPAGNATRAQIATILMRFCEGVAE